MSHGTARRWIIAIGLGVASGVGALPCCADEAAPSAPVSLLADEASLDLLAGRPYRVRDFGLAARPDLRPQANASGRTRLDLSPLAEGVLGLIREQGVPLRGQRDEHGNGPIGVMASFSLGRDVPALSFNLGDRPVDPLGAFYSGDRGFRCALVWPVNRFTLRLEGGEDSEFGYYGIAGVQWMDAKRRLAIGAGIPMNLRDADGDVGAILQLRLRLD
jgi:hypothetical protein